MTENKTRRFLPLLLLMFAGSGCAALIYEIVWFQLLEFVIGSSAVSLGLLLAVYMGGLCLGSLALPRLASESRHPLRVYALLEAGVGIFGLLVYFGMPAVTRIYAAHVGHGLIGLILRGAVCAVCLLPPTVLMGGTLPAISRWVESGAKGVSWLGLLYGANTAGAVAGCLAAGFYVLRVYDAAVATCVAAGINAAAAVGALGLAALAPYRPSLRDKHETLARKAGADGPPSWPAYAVIGLSGLSALGAEVIWTRLVSLMLGGTVYAFSIILAVFLAGLAAGSGLGSALARRAASPMALLGVGQLFAAAGIAWTAYTLARTLPYWPIDPALTTSPWISFQVDVVRCLWAIMPPAVLWGAVFPLALAAARRGQDPGRLVGGIYASSTVGAIIGSLGFSLVLVPWLGSGQSQRLLVGLSTAAALAALAAALFRVPDRKVAASAAPSPRTRLKPAGVLALAAASALGAGLVGSVPKVPWELIAYGRRVPEKVGQERLLYVGEGMNSSVAVTEAGTVRVFHVSGRTEASNAAPDMRMERLLGHLPALLHPDPRSVLVVGCGAGVTAGSFVLYPGLRRIVICEIEPLVPRVVAGYFARENYDVLHDPRVEFVIDDARHYILTSEEKFDVITSDPIHPWIKGSAALYTKEYFELCRRRLNPGGVICQWVPLYQSDTRTVKSELATFFGVFPHGTIWSNDLVGVGYDVVLLAGAGTRAINVDEVAERLGRPDHQAVSQSLAEVGFKSALDLLSTFAGQGSGLEGWLKGAEVNRDRSLRLQYLAGLSLNSGSGSSIFNELLARYEFPEGLFAGSPETLGALRKALRVVK